MNMTDQNAAWLLEQRIRINNEVKKIAGIVSEYALTCNEKNDKYSLSLEIHDTHYALIISERPTYQTIDKVEYWCISSILEHYLYLNKSEVSKKVNECICQIKLMQKTAVKYIKLNKQSHETNR